jgi:hypothetical protein
MSIHRRSLTFKITKRQNKKGAQDFDVLAFVFVFSPRDLTPGTAACSLVLSQPTPYKSLRFCLVDNACILREHSHWKAGLQIAQG